MSFSRHLAHLLLFVTVLTVCLTTELAWSDLDQEPSLSHPTTLFFHPFVNGVRYSNQQIDWDLSSGDRLKMGPLDLAGDVIELHLSQEEGPYFEIDFGLESSTRMVRYYLMSFRWPLEYIGNGLIEIIDDDGKVYWRKQIHDRDLSSWNHYLTSKQNSNSKPTKLSQAEVGKVEEASQEEGYRFLGRYQPKSMDRQHLNSQFGVVGLEFFDIPVWKLKKPFRFCMSEDSAEGRLLMCSRRYAFRKRQQDYQLVEVSQSVTPRVWINKKPVSLKGSTIFVDNSSEIRFQAIWQSGTYMEFESAPKPVDFIDMVYNEKKDEVEIIGLGNPPMEEVDIFYRQWPDFWNFLNFKPSIGKPIPLWKASIPGDRPYIYLRGYGGAPFKQIFAFRSLPKKRLRPELSPSSPRSTYASTVTLHGEVSDKKIAVESSHLEAKKVTDQKFNWEFLASGQGVTNRSYLDVIDGKDRWKAHYDVYRGYPLELSARTTGVVTSEGEIIGLSEVAAQYWLEDLFGWENTTFSRQRWGLSTRYFRSAFVLNDQEGSGFFFRVLNVDLKYRLTPGVWGNDPSVGLIGSFQQVQLEDLNVGMYGVGAFWARSMPSFFNDIFNLLPVMRYPKWVDTEFILYGLSSRPQAQLGLNFALNFHGKIQWTQRFFGELGFGLKTYSVKDVGLRQSISLGTFYGTVGLGYNF